MDNEKKNLTANSNPPKPKKKRYILKRDKDPSHLSKAKESFCDPNKFLKNQQKMVIGQLTYKTVKNNFQSNPKKESLSLTQEVISPIQNTLSSGQKLKKNFFPRSKSLILSKQSYKKTFQSKSNFPNNISCINNYDSTHSRLKKNFITLMNDLEKSSSNNSYMHEKGIHYQIKSLSDIIQIFRKYKNLEEENKNKGKSIIFGNKKISGEIIKDIGKNFSEQEKILNKQKKLKIKSQNFSKLLSKKIKRKEKDLIYNKIEDFHLKRQVIDLMEKAKNVYEKFGANHWVANLRRPKTHNDIRFIYNNTKNELSPDMIIDYADKDIEFINDPNLKNNSKYSNVIKNFNKFKKTHKFNFPNFQKMAELEAIKGKKLLQEELKEFKDNLNNNKYRLYKDPFELNKDNIDDFICEENYDLKYRLQRNRSHISEEDKINNINPKKEFQRAKSVIGGFRVKQNKNKNKVSYLEQALKMNQKENEEKNAQIKFISYK